MHHILYEVTKHNNILTSEKFLCVREIAKLKVPIKHTLTTCKHLKFLNIKFMIRMC